MQVSLRDAARFLGVDESTLQRWARRGEIRAQKVDDQYRFDRVDLLSFAAEHAGELTPGVLPEDAPPAAEELPRLRTAVVAGGVHHGVPGADKASALRAVVDRLPLPPGIDRGFLHQMLLAREQLGSTGLGHGIALPHPRDPIVLRVASPAVSVAFLESAIDFDAVDGRPVHTLFTLVSPSVRVHLHLLSVLAAALRDPAVLACIDRRAPGPELIDAIGQVEDALAARRGHAR